MTKRICISGYYGFDNFGDEMILKVLCENIKRFECSPEITVFSNTPIRTIMKYGVKSVQTFDYTMILKRLIKCNCLISGGGSLLQDVTSSKSLLYYLFVLSTALFLRKKIIIFAQGIGPINNPFLRFLTFMILKRASYITVRDERSRETLTKKHINCSLCSDPVWNINIPASDKTGKIGIQLRHCKNLTEEFLEKLAKFIKDKYSDKEILILSLQNSVDKSVCEKFKSKLGAEIKAVIKENNSNEKVIEDIASCDSLIAMRYHACLIAIKAGIKLLPLSYDIKVENLAKEYKLPYIDLNSKGNEETTFEEFYNTKTEYDRNEINSKKFDFKELEKFI